jgi:hypothetical protein
MMIRTFCSFLAISVHVIPTKFSYDVFHFTHLSAQAKAHIKIWTTFIYVSILAMLPFCASLFNEILAYFYIMTKITFITIRTMSKCFKFITGFNFTSIMKIIASLSAFSMYELFTYSVFS